MISCLSADDNRIYLFHFSFIPKWLSFFLRYHNVASDQLSSLLTARFPYAVLLPHPMLLPWLYHLPISFFLLQGTLYSICKTAFDGFQTCGISRPPSSLHEWPPLQSISFALR